VLIPKFYFTKKYFLFSIIIVLCFFVITFLPSLIIPHHIPPVMQNEMRTTQPGNFQQKPPPEPENNYLFLSLHYLFIFLAVVFFSLILRINNRWRQAEKEN